MPIHQFDIQLLATRELDHLLAKTIAELPPRPRSRLLARMQVITAAYKWIDDACMAMGRDTEAYEDAEGLRDLTLEGMIKVSREDNGDDSDD